MLLLRRKDARAKKAEDLTPIDGIRPIQRTSGSGDQKR